MNLLAGATGFLGNEILNKLGLLQDQTLVLTRRKIDTLPMNTDQMIIDFNKISELELPQIDHVFLSIGFPKEATHKIPSLFLASISTNVNP